MFRVECKIKGDWKPALENGLVLYYTTYPQADMFIFKLETLLRVNKMPDHEFRIIGV